MTGDRPHCHCNHRGGSSQGANLGVQSETGGRCGDCLGQCRGCKAAPPSVLIGCIADISSLGFPKSLGRKAFFLVEEGTETQEEITPFAKLCYLE